eukprot:TRINITY_DN20009_c0_g1_i1.p1 TRINITY_DN20009_c0_g1~~TRINITY_DN20009_c0_g1_i1.p1  ORF type:complete len:172 (-),score=35.13 TRINITY_DN20009_c0_g1_i1:374-889(-)
MKSSSGPIKTTPRGKESPRFGDLGELDVGVNYKMMGMRSSPNLGVAQKVSKAAKRRHKPKYKLEFKNMFQIEPLRWDEFSVGEWVDWVGFSRYKMSFIDHQITGEIITALTKDNLKELGVENDDLDIIWNKIQIFKLKSEDIPAPDSWLRTRRDERVNRGSTKPIATVDIK